MGLPILETICIVFVFFAASVFLIRIAQFYIERLSKKHDQTYIDGYPVYEPSV